MADVRSSEPGGAAVGAGSRAPRAAPRLRLGAHRCSRPAARSPARKVATTLRTTFPPPSGGRARAPRTRGWRNRKRAPAPRCPAPEQSRPWASARAGGGGVPRGFRGRPGARAPAPAHFFVQSSRIPAKLRSPQLTVTSSAPLTTCSTRTGSRQPARGSMLRVPARPPPRAGSAPRVTPPAGRLTSQSSARGGLRERAGGAGRGARGTRAHRRAPGRAASTLGVETHCGAPPNGQDGAGPRSTPGDAGRERPRRGPESRRLENCPGPGSRDPSSPAGGPPGAPAPPGSRVSSPLLAPAPPSLPVSPGSPPPGLAPGWPPGHCGEEVPAARAGSPAGPGRGDAGRRGDTGGPAAAAQSRPRRLGGHLTTPRVLGASLGDERARTRLRATRSGIREGDQSTSLGRATPGSRGNVGFRTTPGAAGGARAPRGQFTVEMIAFRERDRGSPAHAAGPLMGGVGGGGDKRTPDPRPGPAPTRLQPSTNSRLS